MALQNTHYGAKKIESVMKTCKSVFFIGIGGISMSSLALLTKQLGLRAGGSDRGENDRTRALAENGITVYRGHDARQLAGYDAVVYTVAISAENPEYLAAMEAGLPLYSRADYLGWLMSAYRVRIGVAGMHGKSTCTAMCTDILLAAADPTVMCGAELPSLGGDTCRIGRSREHFLFEACEYMDSFLDFSPTIAVVLNIGMDHVDYFHSMEQIRASFRRFAELTGEDGVLLYNADDAESNNAFASFAGRKVSFAAEAPADYTARNVTTENGFSSFDFYRGETVLCRLCLRVCGKHNVYNALAASAAADLAGIGVEAIEKGISSFSGAHRRMERKGTLNGAVVYDDYAHHPDEIKATLAGAGALGFRRILCAYQPHTFSRTAGLYGEFSGAFRGADRVYLTDVYAAREENIYGVELSDLAAHINAHPDFHGSAVYCGDFAHTAEAIKRDAGEGDLILVMGAGDIEQMFPLLLN